MGVTRAADYLHDQSVSQYIWLFAALSTSSLQSCATTVLTGDHYERQNHDHKHEQHAQNHKQHRTVAAIVPSHRSSPVNLLVIPMQTNGSCPTIRC
jgi:hypothetical protein